MTYSFWTPVKQQVDVLSADPVTNELAAQAEKLDAIKADATTLIQELQDHADANNQNHDTEQQLLQVLIDRQPVTPTETFNLITEIRDATVSIKDSIPTLQSAILDGLVSSTEASVAAVQAAEATAERLHQEKMALLRAQDEVESKVRGTHVEQQISLGGDAVRLTIPAGSEKLTVRLMTPDGSPPQFGFAVNGLTKPPGYTIAQEAMVVGKDIYPLEQQEVWVQAPNHVLEWEYEATTAGLAFMLEVKPQGAVWQTYQVDGPGQFSIPDAGDDAPPADPGNV